MDYKEKYKVCGALKSPYDERDYKLSKLIMKAVPLPEEYVNPTPLIIMNQGNIGACVAYSMAQARHITEYNQNGDNKEFSPMYVYGNRKKSDYQGEGMYPRQCLANVKEFGICHREDFDGLFDYPKAHKIYIKNKTELDIKAYPHRISSYYRLRDFDDVKTAIYTLGSAFISYEVYEPLYYPDENGNINYDITQDYKSYGGHQMLAIGWDKTGLIVCNSWGEDYGNHGIIHIPYDYGFSECWAMVDDITENSIKAKYKITLWDKIKNLFRR